MPQGSYTNPININIVAAPTRIISLSGDLDFGNVAVGQTSNRNLNIANTGNSTLTVSGISYPPGFSGSWNGTIAPSGNQNVSVTFAPTSAQSYGGTLSVIADSTSGSTVRSLSGTGTATPTRVISLSGDLSFGNVQVGQTAQRTLTIFNSGNSTLNVSSISFPSGFSGNWSGTVAAGSSQDVTVSFSPTSAQSYGGSLSVTSNASSGTNTRSVSGTGTATPTRVISLSGDLSFGDVQVGQSAQRSLTISNFGNSTLSVSSISYPSGFSGNWSGNIAAGGTQNVTVTFSPSASQTYTGSLSVTSNSTSGTSTRSVSGTGTATPTRVISLSGDLSFGNVQVGQSAQRTLTISNLGNSTLNVSSITYPSGFSGNWSGNVSAGSSQDVTVSFSPTSAQSYGGSLSVTSNSTSGTSTRSVSGTGADVPTRVISLSGDLSFGDVQVGQTAQRTLTIFNSGNSTLNVSSISFPSGFSGNWSGTVAAGGSQGVFVTFSPTSGQSYGGSLTVTSNASSGTNTRSVSGTGTATPTRVISLSGDLSFGNVQVGQTAQRTLTIFNSGNSTLSVSSISYPSGFSGNWSGNVAAGGSQGIVVTFSPSATTSYGGNLSVASDATGGNGAMALSGAGTATITLADAVDASYLAWFTGGATSWSGQNVISKDGTDAARSGIIADNQESWMETTVTGPGTLSFWWKVSSERGFDFLEFHINGSVQPNRISDEVDWQQQTFDLGSGTQNLRWRYVKDNSVSRGDDAGYVDQLVFSPSNSISVTTKSIPDASVTHNSATAGGIVLGSGGTVIERGVVYATRPSPADPGSFGTWAVAGATSDFNLNLTGLSPETTYYVQAYATTSGAFNVTYFGDEQSFTTRTAPVVPLPTVTTSSPANVTHNSAVVGGNVTSNGGSAVTERGVDFAAWPWPVGYLVDRRTSGSGTGPFNINLSGLSPNTTYYYRAYAVNSAGIAYDETVRSFTTAASPSPTPARIYNNQTLINLSGAQGTSTYYVIAVPAGQRELRIETFGGVGDADLYVRFGSHPTTMVYDQPSTGGTNTETVVFDYPPAGDYYIMVHSLTSTSGVSLMASFLPPSPPLLRIYGPRNIRTSRASLALRGTAVDPDGDLAWVKFRVSGPWRSASGLASWRASAALKPGNNRIQVEAGDRTGRRSPIQQVRVFRR